MSTTLQRTYSSPNLKEHKFFEDDDFYVIGDRVFVDGYRCGSVAYFGELEFGQSGDWVGVVLDEPTGNHNGRVHGRGYFQCAPNHGLFVRPHRVSRMPDSALGSSRTSSRLSTPLPTFQRLCGRYSKSPGGNSSILDSYYYDEDYRQGPTVDSLERKLKSIMSTTASDNKSQDIKASKSILKRPESSASGYSTHSKPDWKSISERSRATSTSPARTPVFNFRPRRAQLDEFESSSHLDHTVLKHRNQRVEFNFSQSLKQGDRVVVQLERGARELTGVLRYLGEVEFAIGQWAGVELDSREGKNDGSVLNRRYFHCPKHYGLFLPASRVRRLSRCEEELSQHIRSTVFSPPPNQGYQRSAESSRSPTPTWKQASTSSSASGSRPQSSISPSPKSSDLQTKPGETFSRRDSSDSWKSTLNNSRSSDRELFNDKDIDYQLRKSLTKKPQGITSGHDTKPHLIRVSKIEQIKPVSVTYTFSSSKYDGCPIARRTVQY